MGRHSRTTQWPLICMERAREANSLSRQNYVIQLFRLVLIISERTARGRNIPEIFQIQRIALSHLHKWRHAQAGGAERGRDSCGRFLLVVDLASVSPRGGAGAARRLPLLLLLLRALLMTSVCARCDPGHTHEENSCRWLQRPSKPGGAAQTTRPQVSDTCCYVRSFAASPHGALLLGDVAFLTAEQHEVRQFNCLINTVIPNKNVGSHVQQVILL